MDALRDAEIGAARVTSTLAECLPTLPLGDAGSLERRRLIQVAEQLVRAAVWGPWIDVVADWTETLAADDADRDHLALIVGLALEGEERYAEAAPFLELAASGRHPLAAEARLRAARVHYQLSRESNDAEHRRRALELLAAFGGEGEPSKTAADFLALQLDCLDMDDDAAAPDAQRRAADVCALRAAAWLEANRRAANAPAALLLLARALDKQERWDDVETQCLELIARYPAAPEADPAWTLYGTSRRRQGLEIEPRARYLSAVAQSKRGEWGTAVRELEQLLDDDAAAEYHVECRILLGQTLRRLGRYDDAIAALDAVVEGEATDRQLLDARRWQARAMWSARRIDDAKAVFEALFDEAPSSSQGIVAQWELARMLEDEGRLPEARRAFETLVRRHPRSLHAAEAAWRAGLCSYRQGSFDQAAQDFALAGPSEEPMETERRLYWLGRTRQQLGDEAGTREAFAAAANVWPRGYYGWRAAARLALGPGEDAAMQRLFASSEPVAAAAALPQPQTLDGSAISGLTAEAQAALERGLCALRLGLFDTARRDLRVVEQEAERDAQAMLMLGEAYQAHGIFDRAVSCGWDARQALVGSEDEIRALRSLYPIAFPAALFTMAERNGVDPLLALAIMRRESRFNPEALSHAGARGLMQLMPRTAAGVARRLERNRPSLADLYSPALNMELGTWYLASVLRDFAGRPDQALASYNAGRRKVEEWQQVIATDDPDLFVELIGYQETRNYVKKVLNDYFYYQVVYQHPLEPLSTRQPQGD